MSKENSSKGAIIAAVITSFASIGVAVITGFFGLRAVGMQQEAEATSVAYEVAATEVEKTQVVLEGTAYAPTLTPYPTNPIEPTYTPYPTLTARPTYTPYPTLPAIQATPTLETSLLFEDSFDNEINSDYWVSYGKWMVSNGVPIVVDPHAVTDVSSVFYIRPCYGCGVVLFPGTQRLDNIALEFDVTGPVGVLLSYIDEFNYKSFAIYDRQINSFEFSSHSVKTSIPQSSVNFPGREQNHAYVEIRGNSLVVYMNDTLVYNYTDLPETVTGTIGFVADAGVNTIDNFKIYQLP